VFLLLLGIPPGRAGVDELAKAAGWRLGDQLITPLAAQSEA
jgi:hypothetical protein